MQFEQADTLITDWAAWISRGDSVLTRLSASRAKWQIDYRAPFDPENDPPGGPQFDPDDETMALVDRIMAPMLKEVPNASYRVWWNRVTKGAAHSEEQLAVAFERFLFYFEKRLAPDEQRVLNAVRGRSYA